MVGTVLADLTLGKMAKITNDKHPELYMYKLCHYNYQFQPLIEKLKWRNVKPLFDAFEVRQTGDKQCHTNQ